MNRKRNENDGIGCSPQNSTHTHTHTHTHTDKALPGIKQIGTICFSKFFKFCTATFCFCAFSFGASAYTITFSCGVGSGTPPASINVKRNSTFVLPENTCTPPAGKEFKDWHMTCPMALDWPAGTGMTYQCSSDTTVTANYQSATYSIRYDCGSGGGNAPSNGSATYNSSFTPASNTCTSPSGKSFAGWLVSGTSDIKPAGTAFSWTYTENKTFTAQFATNINLTWDGDSTTTPTSCTYGGTFVPPTPAARTGYVFTGWKVKVETCGIERLDTDISGTAHGYTRLNGNAGSNERTYGLTVGSGQWAAEFEYGVVYGMANCNTTAGVNQGDVNDSLRTEREGQYCWCQATGFTPTSDDYSRGPQCTVNPTSSRWVFSDEYGSSDDCASYCAYDCGNYVRRIAGFRSAVFGVVGN